MKSSKIRYAKEVKEKLLLQRREAITDKMRERDERARLYNEDNIKYTTDNFIVSTLLRNYMESISAKFQLRKVVRIKTTKLGKVI